MRINRATERALRMAIANGERPRLRVTQRVPQNKYRVGMVGAVVWVRKHGGMTLVAFLFRLDFEKQIKCMCGHLQRDHGPYMVGCPWCVCVGFKRKVR